MAVTITSMIINLLTFILAEILRKIFISITNGNCNYKRNCRIKFTTPAYWILNRMVPIRYSRKHLILRTSRLNAFFHDAYAKLHDYPLILKGVILMGHPKGLLFLYFHIYTPYLTLRINGLIRTHYGSSIWQWAIELRQFGAGRLCHN